MSNQSASPRQLIGLGSSIVGSVILGLLIGLGADAIFDSSPLFVAIGLGVGIVCAVVAMVVGFRKLMKG